MYQSMCALLTILGIEVFQPTKDLVRPSLLSPALLSLNTPYSTPY